jgi:hypothetical protein
VCVWVVLLELLVHSVNERLVGVGSLGGCWCLESLGERLGHTQELVTLESWVSVWVSPKENLF